jgi:hypothetical protein
MCGHIKNNWQGFAWRIIMVGKKPRINRIPRRDQKTQWEAHEKGRGHVVAHMKNGKIISVLSLVEIAELSASGKVERWEVLRFL